MSRFLLKAFDFFLFSSLYIAVCAVLMVHQTNHLLQLSYERHTYLLFVFFATVSSYNFHWYLTPHAGSEKVREAWTEAHRHYNFYFFIVGMIGGGVLIFYFWRHWWAMLIAVALTFLYSAPKIPLPFFGHLKRVAIGKTVFLSFVWMYVTTLLPILVSGHTLTLRMLLFCISRFFLIYAICILFDYRDREDDRKDGIRSTITYFGESEIDRLFNFSLVLFAAATLLLLGYDFPIQIVVILLVPGILVRALYRYAKKNFSDYLYYFVLDGLMMLSSLITWFLPI